MGTKTVGREVCLRRVTRAAVAGLVLILASSLSAVPAAGSSTAGRADERAAKPKCLGARATIVGTSGKDKIKGTKKADVIVAGGGNDVVNGRGGDDLICGLGGKDTIKGGGGDDRLSGGKGKDSIEGGPGDDFLDGGPSADKCDGGPGTNELVGCEVTPNAAPVAVDDAATTEEDTARLVPVLVNDTDADADPLTVAAVSAVTGGTASIVPGGVRFAPSANLCGAGAGKLDYTVSDGRGGTDQGHVSVGITCVPDSPLAVNDSATVIHDDPATAIAVLANDSDPEGDSFLIASATQPANGTVVLTGGGSGLTYAPDAGYCNTPPGTTLDTFTYTLAPGGSTATVSVTVLCPNAAPVADDEAFNGASSAIGNTALVADAPGDGPPSQTGPKKSISGDILTGDVDGDGQPLAVVPGTFSTNDGGTVTVQSDGDFVFLPATGTSCTDASDFFDYTVTDGATPTAGTDVGRVTITVTECVWYVDSAAAAGTGSSTSPLNSLASLNGAGGAGDVDDASDYLFLYGGSTFTTGLELEATQQLLGQPNGLTVGGTSLVAAGGTNPAISSTTGNALRLASGNTIQGVNLGGTPAANASLTGSGVGAATMNTVTAGSISNAAGGAVDISNGTLAMAFTSVSSSGATNDGIRLDNTAGTFTAPAGSLQNAGGQDVDLSGDGAGDTVAFTYGGTISDDLGALVNVSGQSGGLKDFNGAITDGNDGDGNGVSLVNNAGATTRFDGGLTLSTGANPALSATGGGSLAITDPGGVGSGVDNTIVTTTGTPLSVVSTTIQDDDLTFRSIASTGAASGIVLNTTSNASGRLVVAGNGGTCSSVATCSGGAIQGSTGPGILLTSVPGGVSLTRVAITAGGDDGIRATTVNDIDLSDSVVLNNGNSHTGGLEERGLDYLNVTGTPDILRTTVSGSDDSNAHIRNNTAGTTTLAVSNSTFSDSKFNAGLRLRGEGASVMNATVQNSTFSLNADPGFSMQTDAANTAQQTLLLTANSFSGGSANAVSGRPQISINADSGSVVKATISSNQVKSAAGAEIIVNSGAAQTAGGSLDARVINNTINDAQPGNLDALADAGASIWGWAHGDGATRIEVRNNTVANWGGRALELSHNDGNGTADFTVTGNTFSTPDATPNTYEGMYIFSGGAAGDTSNVCVDLESNDFDGIRRQTGQDLAIDPYTGSSLRFADFNDTSLANLQANLRVKNPASPTLTVETFGNLPTATTATSCTLTSGTP